MFSTTQITFDNPLKVGVLVTMDFPYTEIGTIVQFESPCDCSQVYNIQADKLVKIKYTPNAIPIHLKSKGQYTTTKSIIVSYIPEGLDITNRDNIQMTSISFTATVVD